MFVNTDTQFAVSLYHAFARILLLQVQFQLSVNKVVPHHAFTTISLTHGKPHQ